MERSSELMSSVVKAPAKAIVPAAGLGRRLSPITNVLPKEMFPIGRHPAIEWVIAEAVASGCRDVAVVISPRKRIIQEYFAQCCPDLANMSRLRFVVQPEPLGLGHALLLACEFCEGQPFAVLLPDNLVDAPHLPLLQMTIIFEARGGAVLAVTEESVEKSARYERLQLRCVGRRIYRADAILARTTPVKAESLLVGVGRSLFSPVYLDYAAMLLDQGGTEELTDGMILQHMLGAGEPVHGVHIEGRRYDISTPNGYVGAWQRFGGERPTWKAF